MRNFFITSSGTGIGKTLVTAGLCWQLRETGENVTALKPVISGYDAQDVTNDSAQILLACGIDPTFSAQAAISPWRYKAALTPTMAAAREGNAINMEELISFSKNVKHNGVTLIEGVGGIMAPLTQNATVLDWMSELNWPIIMVTGNYLGSISHTLTAIETLKTRNLHTISLVVSESLDSSVSLDDTLSTLEKFLPPANTIVKLPRLVTLKEPWKYLPPLHRLWQNLKIS